MTNVNIFAGFDISKSHFDLSILSTGKAGRSAKLSNDQTGFSQLKSILPTGAHCIMEATGPYYLRLAVWLHTNGFVVSVVNPLVIRRYTQMQLRRVKTDKADAAIIAAYGCKHQPQAWSPHAQYMITHQQLDAIRENAIMQLNLLNNQKEAFGATGMMQKRIVESKLNASIKHFQKILQQVDDDTESIVLQHHKEMLANI